MHHKQCSVSMICFRISWVQVLLILSWKSIQFSDSNNCKNFLVDAAIFFDTNSEANLGSQNAWLKFTNIFHLTIQKPHVHHTQAISSSEPSHIFIRTMLIVYRDMSLVLNTMPYIHRDIFLSWCESFHLFCRHIMSS